MKSSSFVIQHNLRGALTRLEIINDPAKMNWVIDSKYLNSVGYSHDDKLFGEFDIEFDDGVVFKSIEQSPRVTSTDGQLLVEYNFEHIIVQLQYLLEEKELKWKIVIINTENKIVKISDFSIWASLAYIMFRDVNVERNSKQSAAVFSSVSPNFTKIAVMRRSNDAPHLGLYQTSGEVLSVGTYNEFTNLFFEKVSPSLDGMLFHKLILAKKNLLDGTSECDWIYPNKEISISPHSQAEWSFSFASFVDKNDFYQVAKAFGHPSIKYQPMVQYGRIQHLSITPERGGAIKSVLSQCSDSSNIVTEYISCPRDGGRVELTPHFLGEHKVVLTLSDGRRDMIVFNTTPEIEDILDNRLNYLSNFSFSGADEKIPFSFRPLSIQGESLGKMNFILQYLLVNKNVPDAKQKIRQVEQSAVHYVKNKWFIDGDFNSPRFLYGDFYRVLDFDYISHLFFLLSSFSDDVLSIESSDTYLQWAADVLNLRCNPELHNDERAKSEAEIPGVAFLYVNELLDALKNNGLIERYHNLNDMWERTLNNIDKNSCSLSAAITEHFYDNAGFSPAAAALALSDRNEAAGRYADLIEANIGFSNDFRAQNPDRWWEALSYMIHTLWGGVTTNAALICGVKLNRPQLVEAAYCATAGIFYMYDWNATATARKLSPGEAASTFSVAGPNINRPDLSRNRFGQSIFSSDGGIFSRIFTDGYTGEDDWDCGEELVAYLQSFGQQTYLYIDGEGLQVVNGEIEKLTHELYRIKSYAPWPNRYIVISTRNSVKISSSSIVYDIANDQFIIDE